MIIEERNSKNSNRLKGMKKGKTNCNKERQSGKEIAELQEYEFQYS
jgi:hypothetical protein